MLDRTVHIVENSRFSTPESRAPKNGVNGVKKFAPLYFRILHYKMTQKHQKHCLRQQKRTGLHMGLDYERYKNKSQLSNCVWYLKSKKKQFNIQWSIFRKAKPCNNGSNYCDLCTTEKLVIAKSDSRFCLNKKSEIVSTCRHKTKFYLKSV